MELSFWVKNISKFYRLRVLCDSQSLRTLRETLPAIANSSINIELFSN